MRRSSSSSSSSHKSAGGNKAGENVDKKEGSVMQSWNKEKQGAAKNTSSKLTHNIIYVLFASASHWSLR